ncbi:hypothetical protein CN987_29450 [Bacillus thuringiensis]|nr:hypothetical protein CN987_29450 [Bacillus thuringiensis]PGX99107.1 hypothetical protein COE39_03715 [Bacillus thuringiensis]
MIRVIITIVENEERLYQERKKIKELIQTILLFVSAIIRILTFAMTMWEDLFYKKAKIRGVIPTTTPKGNV